jgi:hypothetical protein
MEPLKIGDLCLLLEDTQPFRILTAGSEVFIDGITQRDIIGRSGRILKSSKSYDGNIYHIIKEGRSAYVNRQILMKISPDPRIKLEQVREALKA